MMRAPFVFSSPHRGSALLIVLWVIALLSFLMVTTLMVAMQDAETVAARSVVFRARQLAEMGIAVASHPLIKPSDPLLRGQLAPGETFEAMITSEEARLNLNALLTEERRPILEKVLISWGMDKMGAEMLADRLLDWVDPDDFKHLKGAEKREYRDAGFPGRPFNRPFQTLDEAAMVAGMEVLTELKPDWKDWLTLRGSGQLDVNEASAEMIALVTGAPAHLAQALVEQRAGPDGTLHTKDDTPMQSIEEVAALLGIAGPGAEAITAMLALRGTTSRIVSIGRAGDYSRGIAVVLRKEGAIKVLEWREFVVE
ncbi:MAG: general secretion pathway protein GspK [Roseimicrobium sp.]